MDGDRAGNFGRNLREDSASPGLAEGDPSAARAFLQPIAAPSILGLLSFAVATFMVSAHVASWYGNPQTPTILAPFAAAVGGIAQFAAAMWSYKARDGIGTGMHGAWGSFWMGYGVLWLLIGTGAIPRLTSTGEVAYAYWLACLAAITLSGALAATRENVGLATVLHTLWIGAGCLAVGLMTGAAFWEVIGAYVFMLSAVLAWYTATSLMFKGVGTPILPVGKTEKAKERPDFDVGAGEPGVQHGQ